MNINDPKKAEELLEQASKPHGIVLIAADGLQGDILLSLARAYIKQGRQAEAAEILKQFSQVEMENSEADPTLLENIARATFDMRDLQKAKSLLEQVVLMKQKTHNVDDPFSLEFRMRTRDSV